MIQAQIDAIEIANWEINLIKGVVETELSVIPGVGTVASVATTTINNLFSVLESTSKLNDKLIDAKIDAKLLKNSIEILQSRLSALRYLVKNLMDKDLTLSQREHDASTALNSCREIAGLFTQRTNILNTESHITLPYILSFTSIFGFVGKIAVELRPKHKETVSEDFHNLHRSLLDLGSRALIRRTNAIRSDKPARINCTYIFQGDPQPQPDSSRGTLIIREETSVSRDSSHCFTPDGAASNKLSNSYGDYYESWPIKDIIADQSFCGNRTLCFQSYVHKLREEFLKLFTNAFDSIDLDLQPESCQALFVKMDPIDVRFDIPVDQYYPLNLFQRGIEPYKFNKVGTFKVHICQVRRDGNQIPGMVFGTKCVYVYNGKKNNIGFADYPNRFEIYEEISVLSSLWELLPPKWSDKGKLEWKSVEWLNGYIPPRNAILGGYFSKNGKRENLHIIKCVITRNGNTNNHIGYVHSGNAHIPSVSITLSDSGYISTDVLVAGRCPGDDAYILVCTS
ncbi:unnamed protein product [Allacma fusca]|uniref:Uncharacterized protein n=1 Tax=Allacma fusca TaxID=39272 RepID=A0A8J2NU55_9HEXA|nr:unnamed protein product [Allacma fusca]